MKIFVLGLPHTQTRADFSTCAFTMKAYHLCQMMYHRGHEVIHLGVEGSSPFCTENVSVMPESRWKALYGHPGSNFYNLETQKSPYKEYHEDFARNMRQEILKRTSAPNEAIICVTWGGAQQIAVQDLPQFVIESGIGYLNTWAKFRVFESYAWMHMLYGKEGRFDGNAWYDAVIPNAFNPDHFSFKETPEGYFLYLGRLNPDKGVAVACDIAKRVGSKIKIVGQGDPAPFLACGNNVEYVPPVGIEDRKKLLAGAKALICPTCYIGPFEGVNIEAQMSGVPVISTDWGVFAETVLHGVTGYRCRTMEEFDWAARNVSKLSRKACRDWAVANYSLDRVALMYEEYFVRVMNIRNEGWYQPNFGRTQLDSLRKQYPEGVGAKIDLDTRIEIPPARTEWEKATEFESDWWGLEPTEKWAQEVEKQGMYAKYMGLPEDLDLGNPTTVLDVGCGPTSMLLRANRHGAHAIGVDPLPVSQKTLEKYAAANVEFRNNKAEDFDETTAQVDEAWLYNVLQHTEDPKKILEKVSRCAKKVRIFEWRDLPPMPGHPQTLTEKLFKDVFGGWNLEIWNVGEPDPQVYGLWAKYMAIVATRPAGQP